MFTFVQTKSPDTPVSSEMLSRLEQEYGFQIPQMLREYYLAYNGSDIEECQFKVRTNLFSLECCVTQILTVGYGQYDFAYYLTSGRRTRKLPDTLIPFALDEADDEYCWDQTSGHVFYVQADEEDPIPVCEDVETFFALMESGGETAAPAVQFVQKPQKQTSPLQKEKAAAILSSRQKFPLIMLIYLVLTLVSVVLIPFTDGLSVIAAGALGIWTVIFLIIWLSQRLRSSAAVKKYGKQILLSELSAPDTVQFEEVNTYLTKNFIISSHNRLVVTKYSDIVWLYPRMGGAPIKIRALLTNAVEDWSLQAHLKNGKVVTCGIAKNPDQINVVYDRVIRENREILLGYNQKNEKAYRKNCLGYRRQKLLEGLIVVLVIVAGILAMKFM